MPTTSVNDNDSSVGAGALTEGLIVADATSTLAKSPEVVLYGRTSLDDFGPFYRRRPQAFRGPTLVVPSSSRFENLTLLTLLQ